MPMPVKLRSTELPEVLEIETGLVRDDRGWFAELHSQAMFEAAGFRHDFRQDNLSLSAKGTLRGLHYQLEPYGMGKLVRALKGAVFDVAVDLRRGSPSYGKWVGRELSQTNRLALWVPVGFAHGFVALEDDTLVLYKCTSIHRPEAERAVHYADPTIGIRWALAPTLISPKDAKAPTLAAAEANFEYVGG